MLRRHGLMVLVFFSGLSALTYQVLWLRRLSLVFGVTVYAASTVLAAFMAGLAIGSLLAGRLLRRPRVSPIAAFGVAEILIGVAGLASPSLLDAASAIYQAVHRLAPDSLPLLTVVRLACSFVILAVPTALMGLTFPFLTAGAGGTIGGRVGALYAMNTAGAAVGAMAAGFLLIPAIGIQRSFMLAATINVLVGGAALMMSRGAAMDADTEPGATAPGSDLPLTRVDDWRWRAVVGCSGLAALGLEIVWFRLLTQFVEATSHAFTLMLVAVLAGVAFGGALAPAFLRHFKHRANWLAGIQVATALLVVVSMHGLVTAVRRGWMIDLSPLMLVSIVPSAILMGLAFPVALAAVAERGTSREEVGRRVGQMYAANVVGAIVGSLATGFLLVPWLGSRWSLVTLAGFFLIGGFCVPRPRSGWGGRVVVALSIVAFAVAARTLPDPIATALSVRHGNDLLELWRDEGVQTVVSVRGSSLRHELYLNGLHQANDHPEMVKVHHAIGLLPVVLHGDPKDVLVVGLGGGATPGAASQYPRAHVQVVELADGVRRAAPFFRQANYNLVELPNVDIRIDDGRNFLQLTDRRFDVITADLIQPGHAGAGLLYSREYFALTRRALRPHGVVLQWIGMRPAEEYKLIMRTFLDVFPNATLWRGGEFMVGTIEPLAFDPAALDRMRTDPQTREALDKIGLTDQAALKRWFTGGPDEMRAFVGPGLLLTDDRPLVEYHWVAGVQTPPDLSGFTRDVSRVIRPAGAQN